MTAWILRGIDSTSLLSRSTSSRFHPSWSSWNSSALLWGRRSLRLLSRIDQRFSIGLRSGDWEGQWGKRWIPRCLMICYTRFAVCFGSLSCWSAQYLSPTKILSTWKHFMFKDPNVLVLLRHAARSYCWLVLRFLPDPGILEQFSPSSYLLIHKPTVDCDMQRTLAIPYQIDACL